MVLLEYTGLSSEAVIYTVSHCPGKGQAGIKVGPRSFNFIKLFPASIIF